MPDLTRTTTSASGADRPAGRLTATAAALLALLVLLAGCSQDIEDGEQPQLGGEVTQPEQGVAEAGEAQLAPGSGVVDPAADEEAPGEQTIADRGFVDGDFGEVPIPTAAEPFDDPGVEDDVITQSFQVIATSPTELIEFYQGELTELGWAQGQINATGEGTPQQIQATWTKSGQTLLVTATGLDEDNSQLTLQLSGI